VVFASKYEVVNKHNETLFLMGRETALVKPGHHDPTSHSQKGEVMKPLASRVWKHVNANSFGECEK